MQNKPWYQYTVQEMIEEGFKHRMKFGVKELSAPVEINPTYSDRIDVLTAFYPMLETMRKHFSAEEIREVVEIHFKLKSSSEVLEDFVKDVQIELKAYLESAQADLEYEIKGDLKSELRPILNDWVSDLPDYDTEGFWDAAFVAANLQSWSVNVYDEIESILERHS